jgi:tetratricopeptide (TPR) repeat protein
LKQLGDDFELREYYVRICIDGGEAVRARDRLEEWKDSFFHAGRITILQGFYEELNALLADDPAIAETLASIYESVGDTTKLNELDVPEIAVTKAVETADAALLNGAFENVETPDMVGGSIASDVDLPIFDHLGSVPETSKVHVDIDLDLDLDLGVATFGTEATLPCVEDASNQLRTEVESGTMEANESVEIEIDFDFDAMDDLALDFEEEVVEADSAPVAESGTFVAEAAAELAFDEKQSEAPLAAVVDTSPIEESFDAFIDESALSIDAQIMLELSDAGYIENEGSSAELVDVLPSEEDSLTSFEQMDLSEFDLDDDSPAHADRFETIEVEALEELEGFEELEVLEEYEELEVAEELEELEDIEEHVALEDVAISSGEIAFGKSGFGAALNVDAELEEVEFYLQQGLYDDAERVLQTLIASRPDLPELQSRLTEISESRHAAISESESNTFVDLMADLQDDDLLAATDFLDSFGDNTQGDDALSQKLVSELDSSDIESHYNLGIAYKEMDLFDDAIAEFEKAGKAPARALDCVTLTGQCYVAVGDMGAALAAFKSGLTHEGLTKEGRMTLNFELGLLYQMNGQLLEALESFQLVAERDSFFREVGDLIKSLRRELGLDDDSDDGGPKGNRDRVSYV